MSTTESTTRGHTRERDPRQVFTGALFFDPPRAYASHALHDLPQQRIAGPSPGISHHAPGPRSLRVNG